MVRRAISLVEQDLWRAVLASPHALRLLLHVQHHQFQRLDVLGSVSDEISERATWENFHAIALQGVGRFSLSEEREIVQEGDQHVLDETTREARLRVRLPVECDGFRPGQRTQRGFAIPQQLG